MRRFAVVVACVGVAAVLVTGGVALADALTPSGSVASFTGCVSSTGMLKYVKQGDQPLQPCGNRQQTAHLSGGDITEVLPGAGLALEAGDGMNGGVHLGLQQTYRLPQGCAPSDVVSWAGNQWACQRPGPAAPPATTWQKSLPPDLTTVEMGRWTLGPGTWLFTGSVMLRNNSTASEVWSRCEVQTAAPWSSSFAAFAASTVPKFNGTLATDGTSTVPLTGVAILTETTDVTLNCAAKSADTLGTDAIAREVVVGPVKSNF